MHMIKILGSVMIVIASSWLGFLSAKQLILRVKQLQELQLAFQLLEAEIMYAATPLPQALKRVGEKINLPIAQLFINCTEILQENIGVTADQAWQQAVKEVRPQTALKLDDQEVLINFGKHLGKSDREHQKKNLQLAQKQLKLAIKDSLAIKDAKVKQRRYLGVLGGLVVVILLY